MTAALAAGLRLEQAHAALVARLDDALGTHHGLAWADFVLLAALQDSPHGLPQVTLAKRLAIPQSQLLKRLRPLQKLGWLAPVAGCPHDIALSGNGVRLLQQATETADDACSALPV